jgi:hypothetical protein
VSKVGSSNPFQFSLAWLLAFITVIALVSAGMSYGRWQAIRTYGTTEASANWTQWRIDVQIEESAGSGPVRRRPPKSAEPPALMLMRDHFAVCLGLALLLSSVLFGTFMIFIRGAFSSDSRLPIPDPQPHDPPARP